MTLRVSLASRSDAGGRRHNEDDLRHGGHGDRHYAVLSDGAGGHSQGAVASARVVRCVEAALMSWLGRVTEDRAKPLPDLGPMVEAAHASLTGARGEGGAEIPAHRRMHATVVVLWIDAEAGCATWAHVGDSRLYLLRRGQAQRLTRDDSLVQQLVDAGLLSEQEARTHPKRNQLLAALGGSAPVNVHLADEALALRDGDAFLLCSDGWWGELEAADIEACLHAAHDAEDWLDAMLKRVRERAAPGHDNCSAIAVWVGAPAEITLSPSDTAGPVLDRR